MLRDAVRELWTWGVGFPGKKRYEGSRFNVISVTRGCGWVSFFQEKSVTKHLNRHLLDMLRNMYMQIVGIELLSLSKVDVELVL